MPTWIVLRPALLLSILGCSLEFGAAPPPPSVAEGAGHRILFVGSSYLYSQNIPGIVQAMADSAGDTLAVQMIAGPGAALEDHWNDGVASRITSGRFEWVVLQQGPSSLPESRAHLLHWTQVLDDVIVKSGARTALFSAWPALENFETYPAAIESYRLAASLVNGLFIPVASAWLDVMRTTPSMSLYLDGLHPSPEGAYLAALVTYSALTGRTPRGLPYCLRLRDGGVISLSSNTAEVLQAAAARAVGRP